MERPSPGRRKIWNITMFIISYALNNLVSGIIYDTYVNYMQEMAKILLTLLEILEGEEPPVPRPVHGESGAESSGIEQTDDLFSLNMLHPFFTQFRYK